MDFVLCILVKSPPVFVGENKMSEERSEQEQEREKWREERKRVKEEALMALIERDTHGKGIEITPAMIEAGMLQFVDRDRWGESDEECVARIYRAMVRAR